MENKVGSQNIGVMIECVNRNAESFSHLARIICRPRLVRAEKGYFVKSGSPIIEYFMVLAGFCYSLLRQLY
jgi:hypothetical protein